VVSRKLARRGGNLLVAISIYAANFRVATPERIDISWRDST